MLVGRVQLSWADWLRSHSQPTPLPIGPTSQQSTVTLTVISQQQDLSILPDILQQQLGCVPASNAEDTSSSDRQTFMLPGTSGGGTGGSSSSPDAAALVQLRPRGSRLAEVHVQASSAQLLDVLQVQLERCLVATSQQAGLPPTDASVQRGPLAEQAAQQQAAADALVRELDASIDWVETLLIQQAALDSQHRRNKLALPSAEQVQQKQCAALAAAMHTDDLLIQLQSLPHIGGRVL
jgi:hypothetical protein